MLPPDVKILKQTEDATFTDGETTRSINIKFKVGNHGPFTLKLPKDGFTADARDAAVTAAAANYRVS